jgi:DNA polymerase III subunit epsilon
MPNLELEPCRCDTCGESIESAKDGTIEFRWTRNEGPNRKRVDFRIVHNGNVDNGACQVHTSHRGDIALTDLSDGRALPHLLSVQSTDPSWSETDAPTWTDVLPHVSARLTGHIVVSHTPFDRLALGRASDRAKTTALACTWLDSARVVRRTWPQFAKSGYGLTNVATHFGIAYRAHEDARCTGEVLLRAIAETGLTPTQWLLRVEEPVDPNATDRFAQDGNPNGDLFGESVVFTGALSIPRREAAEAAAAAGCRVEDGVTKHTTLLVVGDEDIRRLSGHEKSSKHRKAEQAIAKGQPIRILGESDFRRIVLKVPARGKRSS